MRQWSNDMLRGHPGGRATTWEQWGNSFVKQFKGVVDTMSHSLRIKEDSYIKMFMEKEKAISDAKETLKTAQKLHHDNEAINAKYTEVCANLTTLESTNQKMKTDIKFLKEKFTVSKEKLDREIKANTNLFSTIRMTHDTLSQELKPGSSDDDKKKFLSGANCVELLNPVNPKGETTYLLETLAGMVPLYGPEGVTFVKTDNPHTLAMQMTMYIDSWDNLNTKKLTEKLERQRTS